ncbi:SGNH/GDSL hydrolase family protein [Paenibacillus senegalensis]|uniref:SGNH/GDSL hydrolase family protein n=1 Tax=Paenibacillus senegalensis TaxID=1465766 RepID=UPI00028A055C|nr:SGNH/GDSL hydrolase family protein [Paenibacillus senegalensis]
MQQISIAESLFQGAISVEKVDGGYKPWRIPYTQFSLFPPDGINGKAEMSAGVRLRFASDTTSIKVEVAPADVLVQADLVIGDELIATHPLSPGETYFVFENLADGSKTIDIYLPQKAPTIVKSLSIDDSASWYIPEQDNRPRWVAYGSSITQCNDAFSPAQTWPALVARRHGLNLTCLGYSGNCHLEPMVARMIRDLPADIISLCLGINVYGGATLSPRTFRAAVIGLVQIIREKHPGTPIALMSPIFSPAREENKNAAGFTLMEMRQEIQEAVNSMVALGDQHLHYVHGLTIFDETQAYNLPDDLHPNGPGYVTMGDNYSSLVMEPLLKQYRIGSR